MAKKEQSAFIISNASTDVFPNNNLTRFKNELPRYFEDKTSHDSWEIALSSVFVDGNFSFLQKPMPPPEAPAFYFDSEGIGNISPFESETEDDDDDEIFDDAISDVEDLRESEGEEEMDTSIPPPGASRVDDIEIVSSDRDKQEGGLVTGTRETQVDLTDEEEFDENSRTPSPLDDDFQTIPESRPPSSLDDDDFETIPESRPPSPLEDDFETIPESRPPSEVGQDEAGFLQEASRVEDDPSPADCSEELAVIEQLKSDIDELITKSSESTKNLTSLYENEIAKSLDLQSNIDSVRGWLVDAFGKEVNIHLKQLEILNNELDSLMDDGENSEKRSILLKKIQTVNLLINEARNKSGVLLNDNFGVMNEIKEVLDAGGIGVKRLSSELIDSQSDLGVLKSRVEELQDQIKTEVENASNMLARVENVKSSLIDAFTNEKMRYQTRLESLTSEYENEETPIESKTVIEQKIITLRGWIEDAGSKIQNLIADADILGSISSIILDADDERGFGEREFQNVELKAELKSAKSKLEAIKLEMTNQAKESKNQFNLEWAKARANQLSLDKIKIAMIQTYDAEMEFLEKRINILVKQIGEINDSDDEEGEISKITAEIARLEELIEEINNEQKTPLMNSQDNQTVVNTAEKVIKSTHDLRGLQMDLLKSKQNRDDYEKQIKKLGIEKDFEYNKVTLLQMKIDSLKTALKESYKKEINNYKTSGDLLKKELGKLPADVNSEEQNILRSDIKKIDAAFESASLKMGLLAGSDSNDAVINALLTIVNEGLASERLKTELREMKVRYDEAKASLQTTQINLSAVERENEEITTSRNKFGTILNELTDQIGTAEADKAKLNEKITELNAKIKSADENKKNLNEQIDNLNAEIEELKNDCKRQIEEIKSSLSVTCAAMVKKAIEETRQEVLEELAGQQRKLNFEKNNLRRDIEDHKKIMQEEKRKLESDRNALDDDRSNLPLCETIVDDDDSLQTTLNPILHPETEIPLPELPELVKREYFHVYDLSQDQPMHKPSNRLNCIGPIKSVLAQFKKNNPYGDAISITQGVTRKFWGTISMTGKFGLKFVIHKDFPNILARTTVPVTELSHEEIYINGEPYWEYTFRGKDKPLDLWLRIRPADYEPPIMKKSMYQFYFNSRPNVYKTSTFKHLSEDKLLSLRRIVKKDETFKAITQQDLDNINLYGSLVNMRLDPSKPNSFKITGPKKTAIWIRKDLNLLTYRDGEGSNLTPIATKMMSVGALRNLTFNAYQLKTAEALVVTIRDSNLGVRPIMFLNPINFQPGDGRRRRRSVSPSRFLEKTARFCYLDENLTEDENCNLATIYKKLKKAKYFSEVNVLLKTSQFIALTAPEKYVFAIHENMYKQMEFRFHGVSYFKVLVKAFRYEPYIVFRFDTDTALMQFQILSTIPDYIRVKVHELDSFACGDEFSRDLLTFGFKAGGYTKKNNNNLLGNIHYEPNYLVYSRLNTGFQNLTISLLDQKERPLALLPGQPSIIKSFIRPRKMSSQKVRLQSNLQPDIYSDNRPADFTNQLAAPLLFSNPDQWEVAATSFTFIPSFLNVNNQWGEISVTPLDLRGNKIEEEKKIRKVNVGNLLSKKPLLNITDDIFIRKQVASPKKIEFFFKSAKHASYSIGMDPALFFSLGFGSDVTEKIVKKNVGTKAEGELNLAALVPSSIVVYADMVAPSIVGNSYQPILCVISVPKNVINDENTIDNMTTLDFTHPQFCTVNVSLISTIRIMLRKIDGNPLSFYDPKNEGFHIDLLFRPKQKM